MKLQDHTPSDLGMTENDQILATIRDEEVLDNVASRQ